MKLSDFFFLFQQAFFQRRGHSDNHPRCLPALRTEFVCAHTLLICLSADLQKAEGGDQRSQRLMKMQLNAALILVTCHWQIQPEAQCC